MRKRKINTNKKKKEKNKNNKKKKKNIDDGILHDGQVQAKYRPDG